MIKGRGPYHGPSKAIASTVCQKCLKKDNYECKATAQERPYKARASRTQQLANPKLVPKLSSDVLNDLLRRDGIADEQLAKLEKERGRQRPSSNVSSPHSYHGDRRRSFSMTSASISTISTDDRSRSASPRRMKVDDPFTSQRDSGCPSISPTRKRRRHSSTGSSSSNSMSSYASHRPSQAADRNTRRRRSFLSPDARGRGTRRRRTRSRSNSMDRSQIARHRTSMTPDETHDLDQGPERNGRLSRDETHTQKKGARRTRGVDSGVDNHNSRSLRRNGISREESAQQSRKLPPPPPERRRDSERVRSLSPFSKRLALTQAMNMGR